MANRIIVHTNNDSLPILEYQGPSVKDTKILGGGLESKSLKGTQTLNPQKYTNRKEETVVRD